LQFSLETLAYLATILGTAIALLALIQSSTWISLICLAFVCGAAGLGFYARQKRLTLNSASTVIDGHSLDSLNIANLRRRVNRTFVVQSAEHTVHIKGEDMEIEWKYSGFCNANGVSSMEFSIDADISTPFTKLRCLAFDLGQDPEMANEIQPVLVGAESISKKISVPLLEPLNMHQPFSVLLKFTLLGALKTGFGYYSSTSSFAQTRSHHCVVRLTFFGPSPEWMRVYESAGKVSGKLLKTLPPNHSEPERTEYKDIVDDRDGRSARVYAFWRDSI
jgi:hypothetical protein